MRLSRSRIAEKNAGFFLIFLIFQASLLSIRCSAPGLITDKALTDAEITAHELKRTERQLSSYKFNPDSSIASRIQHPPDFVMKYIREMDGREYTSYLPDAAEIKKILKSVSDLPRVHKKIIKERVAGIYFINDFLGSGMADWVADERDEIFVILFFNPATLKMNMQEWLTYKENTCFIRDNDNIQINIQSSRDLPAFLGILLHESTHAADYVKNITPYVDDSIRSYYNAKGVKTAAGPFVKGIWKDLGKPVESYDFPSRDKVTFYGMGNGPGIKSSESAELYRSLSGTPFVSLYGSMNWSEDLAELLMYYHLTVKLKASYAITVLKDSRIIYEYRPMNNPLISARVSLMDQYY